VTNERQSELVFAVTEDINGGYVAICRTESIVTQGDSWDELRANVEDAVAGYFFDGQRPDAVRLMF
jgi:predicted RNase H-like HicB family nuclease